MVSPTPQGENNGLLANYKPHGATDHAEQATAAAAAAMMNHSPKTFHVIISSNTLNRQRSCDDSDDSDASFKSLWGLEASSLTIKTRD